MSSPIIQGKMYSIKKGFCGTILPVDLKKNRNIFLSFLWESGIKISLKVNLAAPSPERKGMVLGCVGKKKFFPLSFSSYCLAVAVGHCPFPLLRRGSTGEQETWCCTHTDATIVVSRHFSRAQSKKKKNFREMNCRCLSVINYFPFPFLLFFRHCT